MGFISCQRRHEINRLRSGPRYSAAIGRCRCHDEHFASKRCRHWLGYLHQSESVCRFIRQVPSHFRLMTAIVAIGRRRVIRPLLFVKYYLADGFILLDDEHFAIRLLLNAYSRSWRFMPYIIAYKYLPIARRAIEDTFGATPDSASADDFARLRRAFLPSATGAWGLHGHRWARAVTIIGRRRRVRRLMHVEK